MLDLPYKDYTLECGFRQPYSPEIIVLNPDIWKFKYHITKRYSKEEWDSFSEDKKLRIFAGVIEDFHFRYTNLSIYADDKLIFKEDLHDLLRLKTPPPGYS